VSGEIIIDGPYGSGSEHAFDYKKVILVATGIGVTPFVSILKVIGHSRGFVDLLFVSVQQHISGYLHAGMHEVMVGWNHGWMKK
jgi:predicted ferric reductase